MKQPFVASHLLKKLYRTASEEVKPTLVTWSRSSSIVPRMVGYTIAVHNGKTHSPVFITDDMIGHKLGEFALTRTFKGHRKNDKKLKRR
jgi:small subunit ribosomal protein S19